MKYVGIQTQQSRNNTRSVMLLVFFPVLVLALTMIFMLIASWLLIDAEAGYSIWYYAFDGFVGVLPWVLGVVALWFLIAYLSNTYIINRAAHSRPLERKDNKRVYNLVENLCMAQGMAVPKINVIDDESLNAFASGINNKTYAVTLTTGIIETLDDDELEGVIAHELTHIRNRDVRVLIVSIVFVGIFSLLMWGAIRTIPRIRGKNTGPVIVALIVVAALAGIGSACSSLTKFAISRKREYMADAGAAEMTRKPQALASALRKISGNCEIESVKRADIAQLYIEHGAKGKSRGLLSTHPPIEKRIKLLEQF